MLAAALVLLTLAAQAPPPDSLEPPNAFAGFESHELANGLRVWYKRLPDDPLVSISVALAVGADTDPRGKEQLAHFTEHMLLSDQPGRSEEEVKREIEALGGIYNASVSADRTFYYVRIGKEHAVFALDWLYRVLTPHEMDPEVVDRQRQPIALEINARPRELIDWVWVYYLNPTWLRLPGFWEREFGIETLASRDYYPYASLNRISSDDLRRFYDTYYVPSLMTLSVIGDIERDDAFAKIDETFARLPARPAPETRVPLTDPGRHRKTVFWTFRPNVHYSERFKFYDLTPDQELKLLFVNQFLQKRLNDRLRFGERKATYGVRVGIIKRARAAYLHVVGSIKASEFDYARGVLEEEIDALRNGTLSSDEFESDRGAVSRQLRVNNTGADDLERWVAQFFFDRRLYNRFPDVAAAFDTVSQASIESFVLENFVPERRVSLIVHPHPIPQLALLLIVLGLLWASTAVARHRLTRPVDLTRLRYVARFRLSPLYLAIYTLVALSLAAIAGRLLIFAYQLLADRLLLDIEYFVVQWSAFAAMLVVTLWLVVFALAHVPRKILLFDDCVLIKHLAYRSVTLPRDEIDEIGLRRFQQVWMSREIFRCVPLALGLVRPGVFLKSKSGRAYFFNVRDRNELLRLVGAVLFGDASDASVIAQTEGR